MPVLLASGAPWALPGPLAVVGYAGALVVLVLVALLLRRSRGRADASSAPVTPAELAMLAPAELAMLAPAELAMLAAGERRAAFAALVGLRASGLVTAGERGHLAVTRAAPSGLTSLDRAVYDAARDGTHVDLLAADLRVRLAADEVHESLVRRGYLPDRGTQARARLGAVLLLVLAAVGASQVVAGLLEQGDVLLLTLLVILTIVVGARLLKRPGPTAAGRRALHHARHPADAASPDAATQVALDGTGAVITADPGFADEAGLTTGSIDRPRRQDPAPPA